LASGLEPIGRLDALDAVGSRALAYYQHQDKSQLSDDALAQSLQAAGERALDPCWRMPLDEEYADGLKTNFADVANVAGRAGGAITAAKFLHRFTAKYPWAHLDIAGTAWKSGAAKGSTGRPVGLLVQFLLDQQGSAPAPAKRRSAKRK